MSAILSNSLQFSLKALFVVLTLCALAIAICGPPRLPAVYYDFQTIPEPTPAGIDSDELENLPLEDVDHLERLRKGEGFPKE